MPDQPSPRRRSGITLVELLMDWIVPCIGGMIFGVIALDAKLGIGWVVVIALGGSLVFQWTIALFLLLLARVFSIRQK